MTKHLTGSKRQSMDTKHEAWLCANCQLELGQIRNGSLFLSNPRGRARVVASGETLVICRGCGEPNVWRPCPPKK